MTSAGVDISSRRASPTFGVVIVNWNNAPDTISCLGALTLSTQPPRNVVVVDNGSKDDSITVIDRWNASRSAEMPLHLIAAGENLGFAGGTNLGLDWLMTETGASHLVLLNNDATVSPGFFADLTDSLSQIGEDAVVGPTIFEDPSRDTVWYAGAREIHWRALVQHTTQLPKSLIPRATDFVSGCVMVISRGVVERIGTLAECFSPAYFEDGDYCQRAKKAGFPVMYAPAPVAYHKVGSTVRAANLEQFLISCKNRLRVVYVRRNYTGRQKAIALSYLGITKPARFLFDSLTGHPARGWTILSGAIAGFTTRDVATRPKSSGK